MDDLFLIIKVAIVLDSRPTQSKCRECVRPDISRRPSSPPLLIRPSALSSACAPPGLPPISRSPVSDSQEQPGDREATLLQQQSLHAAVNTAGEHLIIHF